MKISEVTTATIKEFLKLDSSESDVIITAISSAAKNYIMSYTGLPDKTITGEIIGTGDGVKKVFYLQSIVVKGSQTIYVDGVETTDYVINDSVITFNNSPTGEITADYKCGIDAYEDLSIAMLVLCSDMFDNRQMTVQNDKVNKVVQSILDMHCLNLL